MNDYKPIKVLPGEFQREWLAQLHQGSANLAANDAGSFRLVGIRRTAPMGGEGLKIIVLVVDENGFPIPGVKVAFSYSTANQYEIGEDFVWTPPSPFRADIFPTTGGGAIEHVQGSVIKKGQPGGITVYCLEPEYSSDYVTGAGALASHEGMHLTFQLRRAGVVPLAERLADVEERLAALEGRG